MLLQKLYVRIWLAVVFAVAVLTLLVGWAWRMAAEPPLREVVVRNESGEIIGNGQARLRRPPPFRFERRADVPPQVPAPASTNPSGEAPEPNEPELTGRYGNGPEFMVQMHDGQTMHLHLPRPPQTGWRAPFGFFWTLGLVAIAVALGTYPIVRRLTRRLETLQHSVQRWGNGDLAARAPIHGDDEVGFLASRFNHAAQQIETLVKSQKSLLANASHELRSPLTRIRMGLELLGNAPTNAAKDEISRNIGELDQLIDEILLASRLDAKEVDLGTVEPVDLVGLAAEECARTPAVLEVQEATLVVPGVAKLLRRVVRNLLENARRYGGASDITVSLHREGAWAVLQVNDRGPGVPEALQERIFEPFYRLPGASEQEGGVGLGLSLVKSITERLGGSVRCSNRPDGGACFEVRMPLMAG